MTAARVPLRAAVAWGALVLTAGCADAPAATPPSTLPLQQVSVPGEILAGRLGCASCHADMPRDPSPAAPPIEPGGLPAGVVLARLLGRADHPPDFHLDEAEALALALFVGREDDDADVRRARRRHRDIAAAAGRRIYIALNCAGCHDTPGIDGRATAPPLGLEAARVQPAWLERFLLEPSAIRPFGAVPGTGSRMPRFALSRAEADSLVAFLTNADRSAASDARALPQFTPTRLSAFDTVKVRRLIESRFSCLGCHALGGRGGRLGPDLDASGERLRPAWIRAMLEAPHRLATDGLMPPTRAPAATLDLIASYLASRTPGARDTVRAGYLSLADNRAIAWDAMQATPYLRLCAGCHGEAGAGDGWNAPFLHARPAVHADSASMSLRTDDVLFDAIAAGARFLDRSPEMPGFGASLPSDSIRSLVAHIRRLCRCAGPAWSRDGTRP